jgi:CRP/FNR family transcriptional regulator, polysaccharide utilization system transcription regulator
MKTVNPKFNNTCATYLNEFKCFGQLTDSEKFKMDSNSVEIIFKKGEMICKQGSFASFIIYLEEGLVKSYLEGSPRDLILTITSSQRLVGLSSIFEGNNNFLYSVSTYVESKVKLIDINVFKEILNQNATFASEIINILNENTSQSYGRFYCLVMKQLHGRLADIILCLSQRIFKNSTFDLPLSRTDLAELTGMSTESVIRILKDFKDNGLIKMTGKSLQIIDVERLQKISDFG